MGRETAKTDSSISMRTAGPNMGLRIKGKEGWKEKSDYAKNLKGKEKKPIKAIKVWVTSGVED